MRERLRERISEEERVSEKERQERDRGKTEKEKRRRKEGGGGRRTGRRQPGWHLVGRDLTYYRFIRTLQLLNALLPCSAHFTGSQAAL